MPNFNQFTITSTSQKSKVKTKIYLATPSAIEKLSLGQLFTMVEIRSENPKNEEILETINSIINQEYYHSTSQTDFELVFEKAISELDKRIQPQLVGLPDEWFLNLNIVIAAVKEDKLVFTNLGKVNAFLIFKGKIINIIEPSKEKINPLKLLTNISSGQLPQGSLTFFSNEGVLDYFSQEKIKKTLEENSPDNGLKYLENVLKEQNGTSNFAALVISMLPEEKAAGLELQADKKTRLPEEQLAIEENDSMTNLIEKEAKTKELLTPSVWPALKKGIGNLRTKAKDKMGKGASIQKTAKTKERGKALNALVTVLVVIKNLLVKIIGLIVAAFRSLAKRSKTHRPIGAKKPIEGLPARTTGWFSKVIIKFKKLSTARKALLVLALVLIILFAWSITGIGQRREKTLQEAGYQEILNQVEIKINEAKAAMLYENEEGAREILAEASNLLAQIPDDKKWSEEKGAKHEAISEQFKQVSHVITIEEPTAVLDFNSINPAINLSKIFKIGNLIYSFDANNKSIYQADLSDKSSTTTYSSSKDGKPLAIDDINANNLAILYESNQIDNYSINNKELSELKVGFENKDLELKDFNAFSSRIYTLDVKNKQIFRHSKSGDGYTTGVGWLSGGLDQLSNAVSMAVDGSIYILYSDGTIDKFNAGNKDTDFNSPSLDPSLANATKIYTDETLDYIYVLDPNNKRLVILEKSGKLVNQYFSEKFNNLLDFSIDEENKSAYLLNGTQLLQIDI